MAGLLVAHWVDPRENTTVVYLANWKAGRWESPRVALKDFQKAAW